MVKPFGYPDDQYCQPCDEVTTHRAGESAGWRCVSCGNVKQPRPWTIHDVGRAGLWFFLAVNVLLAGLTLWRIFQP